MSTRRLLRVGVAQLDGRAILRARGVVWRTRGVVWRTRGEMGGKFASWNLRPLVIRRGLVCAWLVRVRNMLLLSPSVVTC